MRNADGSLAARHEFNNALDNTGREVLAGLLARGYFGVRRWEVRLSTPAPTCDLDATGCSIVEFIGTGTRPPHSLSVYLPMRKGGNDGYVQLTGTARFVLPGAISAVSTGLSLCHNTACSEVTITHGFTSHTLTTPIPVAAGQLVEVTVFLNFS